MATGNFEECMEITARWEGGFVNDPHDPGGATKYGITIHTLTSWRRAPQTPADVLALTKDEALAIYKAWYWKPVMAEAAPAGVDLVLFDCAVNSGPGRSVKIVQDILGVKVDGLMGMVTMDAILAADAKTLINDAIAMRLAFLRGLRGWSRFGRGWKNRCLDVRDEALIMANVRERPKKPEKDRANIPVGLGEHPGYPPDSEIGKAVRDLISRLSTGKL